MKNDINFFSVNSNKFTQIWKIIFSKNFFFDIFRGSQKAKMCTFVSKVHIILLFTAKNIIFLNERFISMSESNFEKKYSKYVFYFSGFFKKYIFFKNLTKLMNVENSVFWWSFKMSNFYDNWKSRNFTELCCVTFFLHTIL